jgi:hypothetical protein
LYSIVGFARLDRLRPTRKRVAKARGRAAAAAAKGIAMWKHVLAALFAAALISAPGAPVWAQAKSEKTETKSDTKAAKKLTPQQQKMKDCGAKWQAYKKEKNVKGQAEYRKFQSSCLKG